MGVRFPPRGQECRGSSVVERLPEEQGVGCSIHPRGTKTKMVSVAQWQSSRLWSEWLRVRSPSDTQNYKRRKSRMPPKLSAFQGLDRINRPLILIDENDEIDEYQKRLKNRRIFVSIWKAAWNAVFDFSEMASMSETVDSTVPWKLNKGFV